MMGEKSTVGEEKSGSCGLALEAADPSRLKGFGMTRMKGSDQDAAPKRLHPGIAATRNCRSLVEQSLLGMTTISLRRRE
jgi:hypothetical protein